MGLLQILEKSGKTWNLKYCRNFQDLEKFSKLLLVWKSRKIPENYDIDMVIPLSRV